MIQLTDVSKVFRTRRGDVAALDGVTLHVGRGEFVVVRGPSGSGKTTLLLAIGGMLRPTRGLVVLDGRDIRALSEPERARWRADNIGFVFQMFHLIPYLTLLENVLLAAGGKDRRSEAEALVERFGLADRRHHKPAELSAGEKQRAAIARALLNGPKVILADEPTGNLDPQNAAGILECLAGFHEEGGTVILATHGEGADRHASRIVLLNRGRLEEAAGTERQNG